MCNHSQRKETENEGIWGVTCINCGKFYPYIWNQPYIDFPSLAEDLEDLSYA